MKDDNTLRGHVEFTWETFIEMECLQDDSILYHRYIGMANPGGSAWDSFEEDLNRTSGFYHNFLSAIKSLYPEVLENIKIYDFPGSGSRCYSSHVRRSSGDELDRYLRWRSLD